MRSVLSAALGMIDGTTGQVAAVHAPKGCPTDDQFLLPCCRLSCPPPLLHTYDTIID